MVSVALEDVIVSLQNGQLILDVERKNVTCVGGFSDSRRDRSSGGSSSSLKGCWSCLAEKGISLAYCVAILALVVKMILSSSP